MRFQKIFSKILELGDKRNGTEVNHICSNGRFRDEIHIRDLKNTRKGSLRDTLVESIRQRFAHEWSVNIKRFQKYPICSRRFSRGQLRQMIKTHSKEKGSPNLRRQ